jgi:N-glycosylase/DNA lyase
MFVMEIPFMNLKHIAESGQVFRWECISEDSLRHKWKYLLFVDDECLLVTQSRQTFSFKCSEEEFWGKWYDYFDLGFEYDKAFYSIDKCDECLRIAANKSQGIRILNQNLWEVMLSAVISDNVSFEQAKRLIKLICKTFGEKKKSSIEGMQRVWYTFPSAQKILVNCDKLWEIGLGNKADLIYELCLDYDEGQLSNDKLTRAFYEDIYYGVKNYLKSFDEISTRAANFIAVYGYRHKDILPVDTVLQDFFNDEYNINSQRQFKELYEEIFERYKGYRGLIGLYLNREAIKRKEEMYYGFD